MKRTINFTAAFTLAVCSSVTSAGAATEAGVFAARGIGAQVCTNVVNATTDDQRAALRAELATWIAGYMSAVNRTTDKTFDAVPVQNLLALAELTRNVCANNPDKLVENVFSAVVDGFAEFAINDVSDMTTMKSEKYQVTVRQETLLEVQTYLAANGLLEAKFVDGEFGPKTSAVLKAFQAKRKITESGLPDAMTLFLISEALKGN